MMFYDPYAGYYVGDDFNEYDEYVEHYGKAHDESTVGRGSGRYAWGSGKDPYQHGSGDFLSRVEEMARSGMTEKEIAEELGISTGQLRAQKSVAKNERNAALAARVREMRDNGYSLNQITRELGFRNDSSVRNLLAYTDKKSGRSVNKVKDAADIIRARVDDKGFVDLSSGAERYLNISPQKLKQATTLLEKEGYFIHPIGVKQVTNENQQTITRIIMKRNGLSDKKCMQKMYEAVENGQVESIVDFYTSADDITHPTAIKPPTSVDSKRILVRYAEDGGLDYDGTIFLRPGVKDLDLNSVHFAQVRIAVDGTHYIKGMALYGDPKDFPKGVDIIINSNKKKGTPLKGFDENGSPNSEGVLKKMKKDPNNPFGALIKEVGGQSYYDDANGAYIIDGKKKSLSPINKIREEGDYDEYSRKLPAQFLAKQDMRLIKSQLDISYANKVDQLNDILALNNPTIRRHELLSFSNECDSAALHLEAAGIPRESWKVILPIKSLKNNECYVPTYDDGEKLAFIRYPFGGTFECPILINNTKHVDAKRILGQAKDAAGINSTVAARLSGADFDGDTVMIIPVSRNIKITSTPELKGLKGFEPKIEYGTTERYTGKKDEKGNDIYEYISNKTGKVIRPMTRTNTEMGKISNLIMDMTIKGADEDKLARAVRHSMVVIDAEKHHLDWKLSEKENGIAQLKRDYQKKVDKDGNVRYGGASTLITRAKSESHIPETIGSPRINLKSNAKRAGAITLSDGRVVDKQGFTLYDPKRPEGAYIYKQSGKSYVDKNGKVIQKYKVSAWMNDVDDANQLSAGYPQEKAYASYANKLKALANRARVLYSKTERYEVEKSATIKYKAEVSSLKAKLNRAIMTKPKERRAQVIATGMINRSIRMAKEDGDRMTKKDIKKLSQISINNARRSVGLEKGERLINIEPNEWKAIQAHAISDTTLSAILDNTDIDKVRAYATPKVQRSPSPSKQARMKALAAGGYTLKQIADATGFSVSTVSKYI